MATRDLIGKRGESIAEKSLMNFCGNTDPYFDVHPLGEKCPTFDYLVELVNAGESVPYFLAQVKSTQQGFTKNSHRLLVQRGRRMFGGWSNAHSRPTSSG